MNKSKWEINPTEGFGIEFEKTTVYQCWQDNYIKKRKIMFELCKLKKKKCVPLT